MVWLQNVKTVASADASTALPHHESPGTVLVSHHPGNASFMLNWVNREGSR